MEAAQRDGLLEIVTMEKQRAFLAVKPAGVERVEEGARKPPIKLEETKRAEKKTEKVIGVDRFG